MYGPSCEPYRGHGVYVEVTENQSVSFNGTERRYAVAWYVYKREPFIQANVIARFAEPVEFLSTDEAVRYAEGRAHTFVDCSRVISRE
ncbi:hypothetical protein [Paraburkholderia sp. GAS32]|uniref:hypothetical protein n=1 Tax=Paraburkholderia sp. GAS32 TaxID=3035129 RepID=UPI003D1CBBFE